MAFLWYRQFLDKERFSLEKYCIAAVNPDSNRYVVPGPGQQLVGFTNLK
jgi:hypothetical protein